MSKKIKFLLLLAAVLIIAGLVILKIKFKPVAQEVTSEIKPTIGAIQTVISTTGTVLPKNRLEIKPPVNGRVEQILVAEGEKVKTGQILAWMSSTERAALLDAAHSQGEEQLKYWEKAYKPIALLSPIDGEVIVATVQPGQSVTTVDAVVVLSDTLIVRAQVDETDIGKVKLEQDASIGLDAYPETNIKARVEHIYYESKTVNNVTIYEVDLLPAEVPLFFRSGMNATVNFVEHSRENALIIPLEAVHREKEETYVLIRQGSTLEPVKKDVQLGISDNKNVEVISGISADDMIIVKSKKLAMPKNNAGTNPFVPFGQRRQAR